MRKTIESNDYTVIYIGATKKETYLTIQMVIIVNSKLSILGT